MTKKTLDGMNTQQLWKKIKNYKVQFRHYYKYKFYFTNSPKHQKQTGYFIEAKIGDGKRYNIYRLEVDAKEKIKIDDLVPEEIYMCNIETDEAITWRQYL